MDWKYSNEVSSFFLFEASGDSEGDNLTHFDDSELYLQDLFSMRHGVSIAQHDDNVDAESCSYGSVDMIGFHDEIKSVDVQIISSDTNVTNTNVTDDVICEHDHDLKCDFSCTCLEVLAREEREEEARGDVHGTRENVVDEVERNRLFWETCLEVGFPMDYNH
ncbi:hypothetical protein Acr_29g0010210 [Actinidia rufa]|uniref:Uncharacterized protein n=1 Tax=Actinidia rufa TaxID=165716 RepID=A0A7J0HFK0_9ERIC|nr:hypothetical protein Acr_29g0010210 [Actinidia rufa]